MRRLLFLITVILFAVSSFAGSKDKVIKVDGHSYEIWGTSRKVAFVKCKKKAVKVIIPDKIEYKGNYYTVVEIGASAFEGNQKLVSVIIPQNVYTLEDYCFSGCSALQEVKFESTSVSLHNHVFNRCSSLKQINLPIGTKVYEGINGYNRGGGCFSGCSSLTEIVLPKTFNMIDSYMFHGCSSLKMVVINNPYCKIGINSFEDCSALQEIKVIHQWDGKGKIKLDGLHSEDGILYNNENMVLCVPCGKQGNIVLNKNTQAIGAGAFRRCKLSSVTLQNVQSVSKYAFWPSSIDELRILSPKPPVIVEDGGTNGGDFISSYIKTLVVPKGSKAKYQNAIGWKLIKNIIER